MPVQRLKDKDKRRAAYYRFYTDMKWGQEQNYHISLDSGELGIEKCVELITELLMELLCPMSNMKEALYYKKRK